MIIIIMYDLLFKHLTKNATLLACNIFYLDHYNKFDIYYNQIVANPFLLDSQKQGLGDLFCKIQRNYYRFKLFEQICYRRLHNKKADVDFDLGSTHLSQYSERMKLVVVENDTEYPFYIPDLVKIITYALLQHENLFANPSLPRNPHTNLPFSKANLYRIYLILRERHIGIPDVMMYFFKSECNVQVFQINYEANLRDIHLVKYYDSKTVEEKYDQIIAMLHQFKLAAHGMKIHSTFDHEKVIKKLGGILYHYGVWQYSFNPTKRQLSENKIKRFLRGFKRENPYFGRIKYNSVSIQT